MQLSQVWVSYWELGLGPVRERHGENSSGLLLWRRKYKDFVYQVPWSLRATNSESMRTKSRV